MKTITKPALALMAAILCLVMNQQSASAQSAVAAAHLSLDSIGPTTSGCTFLINLEDTVDVSQIEVTLGSTPGDSNLVIHSFEYDVTTGLPAGFSYQRAGLKLFLQTGVVDKSPTWFGRIRIKDGSGNWDDPYEFISN